PEQLAQQRHAPRLVVGIRAVILRQTTLCCPPLRDQLRVIGEIQFAGQHLLLVAQRHPAFLPHCHCERSEAISCLGVFSPLRLLRRPCGPSRNDILGGSREPEGTHDRQRGGGLSGASRPPRGRIPLRQC